MSINRRRILLAIAASLAVITFITIIFAINRLPVGNNLNNTAISLMPSPIPYTVTSPNSPPSSASPELSETPLPPSPPPPTTTREPTLAGNTTTTAFALTSNAIAALSSPLPSELPSTPPPPTETQEPTLVSNTTATAFALTSDAKSTVNAAISSPPPATLTSIAMLVTATFTVNDDAGRQIGTGQVRVRAPAEMQLNGTGNIEVEIEIDPQSLLGNATYRPANTPEPLLNTPPPSPSPLPTIPGNPFFLSIYEYMGVELQSARLSRFDIVAIPPAAPPPYDVRHFEGPGVVDVWKWQISPNADAVGDNPFVLSIYARKDPFSSQYTNVIIKTIDLPIRVIDPKQQISTPSVGNISQPDTVFASPIVLFGIGVFVLALVIGIILWRRRPVRRQWGIGRVFISYRRVDSAEVVGRIYDRLAEHFGKDAIFKDVNSIYPGENFKVKISDSVAKCTVLLAVIGDQWLTIKDEQGNRRLDNPDDFVRLEIESALERKNITVIPLIVRAAHVPDAKELPPSLSSLVSNNALPIRPDPDFDTDISRLIVALEKALGTPT